MNNLISKNPLNGKKYIIPEVLDDSNSIDLFLKKNKKPVVVVQGLGFVGSVMSLVCANAINGDYAVIGVDLPNKNTYWKIKSINEGFFPIISSDKKVKQYFNLAKKKGNFYASYDSYAYKKADIIIVDINLDVDKNLNFYADLKDYDVNLSPFKNAIKDIGDNCKEDVLILIETTVPPGTTEKIVYPIIKNCLKKRGIISTKFKLGHSYERVMPGPNYIDSIQNFYRVYSGININSANATERFLKSIISTKKYPLTRLGSTNSTEIAKVLENSYRASNIAFMVEWTRFAEEAGVDLFEVINAIKMRPTHQNMMYPGIGVGGYCLTKDPLLASWSRQNIFGSKDSLYQSEKGVRINDKMPLNAYDYLIKHYAFKSLKNKNILLLGISYRSDVGDTRYTPVEFFYNYLKKDGANIFLHDPYVKNWEELNINIDTSINNHFKNKLDIIVFTTAHTQYKNSFKLMKELLNCKPLLILDSVGILNQSEINDLKEKHIVKIIGRGDV